MNVFLASWYNYCNCICRLFNAIWFSLAMKFENSHVERNMLCIFSNKIQYYFVFWKLEKLWLLYTLCHNYNFVDKWCLNIRIIFNSLQWLGNNELENKYFYVQFTKSPSHNLNFIIIRFFFSTQDLSYFYLNILSYLIYLRNFISVTWTPLLLFLGIFHDWIV